MSKISTEKETYYEKIFMAAKRKDTEEFRDLFLALPDHDQVEVFHLLYPSNKERVELFLSADEFEGVFEHMEFDDRLEAFQYLSEGFLIKLFKVLPDDVTGRFFSDLEDVEEVDQGKVQNVIIGIGQDYINELLSYELETAGFVMTKKFVSINQKWTIANVMQYIRKVGDKAETIYYVYVVDNQKKLVGVMSLRDILLADQKAVVEDLMNSQVTSVPVSLDQEEVAKIIQEYDLIAIPVVDKEGRIKGIVTVDDIMDIVEEEVNEDFNEFVGIRQEKTKKETPVTIAKSRTPWILVLLVLGMFTGTIISAFEETLQSVVLLAAFIPMMMSAAGNVGMQSLVVAVRDLNRTEDKISFKQVMHTLKNELNTGFYIGLFSGVLLFLTILIFYRNLALAVIVSLSIVFTVGVSTAVGALVPIIMKSLNFDPASSSGPFISSIADIVGLLIYFGIATSLMQYL